MPRPPARWLGCRLPPGVRPTSTQGMAALGPVDLDKLNKGMVPGELASWDVKVTESDLHARTQALHEQNTFTQAALAHPEGLNPSALASL